MTAVIRVKRKITEEPLDAVIINCKRRKTTEDEKSAEDNISAILKFAGTINTQDDSLTAHIKKITKDEAKNTFKKHIPNIKTKLRNETRLESQKNRFKVVNCSRELEELDEEEKGAAAEKHLTVLDIETNAHSDLKENIDSTSKDLTTQIDKFVYDLYYAGDVEDMVIDNLVSIQPYNVTFDYEFRNADGEFASDDEHDSDDSNEENFYKNDYPDSDNSINETDMSHAMNNCDLGVDLSDDDDEHGFVYAVDSEAAGFEEDVDDSDVLRYGERYASYRSSKKKKDDSDSDDDEVDYKEYYDDGDYGCESE